MMSKKLLVFFIALLPMVLISCHDDDDDLIGLWERRSDFDGLPRDGASYFTIGTKGYLIGGFDGTDYLQDVWEYDMGTNIWTRKADFPGTPRHAAIAFTINGKGYYGTGYNGDDITNKGYLKDFWEYDPSTNSWSQKTDFRGTSRYYAVAFAVGGKGYIGCGYDSEQGPVKDFFEYNPNSDSWSDFSYPGTKRLGSSAFVINDIVYLVGGQNNQEANKDFWRFDYKTGEWLQLRDISNTSDDDYDDDYTTIMRLHANVLVIDGYAYLTCGEVVSGGLISNTWKYDPDTDLWEETRKFKGSSRRRAVSFTNGSRGFIVAGGSSTYFYDDMWELDPYVYDDDDF